MNARPGDRICVNSSSPSTPPRMGTVLDVKPGVTSPLYRVAWDDGSETTLVPSMGAAVVTADHAHHDEVPEATFGCRIDVTMREKDGECLAVATLVTPRGSFSGEGESHRHPDDTDVPMIGEELAMGRALKHLGRNLTAAAMEAIEDHESRPIHLLNPI